MAPSGIQIAIRSLGGAVVTCVGSDKYIMIIYHASGACNSNQVLSYILIDTQVGETVCGGNCPITSGSKLTWAGYSQQGVYPACANTFSIL